MLTTVAGCSSYQLSNHTPSTSPSPPAPPPPPVGTLTIAPEGPCIEPSGSQQFTATLTNLSGSSVTWSVDAVTGGNLAVGTINSSGLYTAPVSSGQHTIGAVSQSDSRAAAATGITVTPSAGLSVSPASANLLISGQQSFQALACGLTASNTTWTVDGVAGGNASVGTITSDGVYTAPASPGTHTIAATNTANHHTSQATVNIFSGILADFGSRTDRQYPVPAGILGVNHADWFYSQADEKAVAQAGFKLSRTYANIPQVYAARTPNWSAIDPQISKLRASGFQVLLQLLDTPSWLQPNPNSCTGDKTKAPPANANTWAQLAKSYVAHMDATFPGVVTEYEIWNEPDSGGLCGTADNLNSYLEIYAAAAPAIKQQAAADGFHVRVGGPALSSMKPQWIQALLSGRATAPYVDFVSYHQYFAGPSEINLPFDSSNGAPSIYSLTRNTVTGAAATFTSASQLVAAGNQPYASKTPVYVDEFNTNWAFLRDCCRNSPTYSPVWNALYISDLLNAVYSGVSHLPGQLTYYAAVSLPYFCVLGDWNAAMDCSHTSGAPVPYPQYYAYQLMASSDYLGINEGGYMAASIAALPAGSGVSATAFYTAAQDSILIVNPTGKSYSDLLDIHNPGFASPTATLYQIDQGKAIKKSPLGLTKSSSGFTAPITIPPYTVLGISIK